MVEVFSIEQIIERQECVFVPEGLLGVFVSLHQRHGCYLQNQSTCYDMQPHSQAVSPIPPHDLNQHDADVIVSAFVEQFLKSGFPKVIWSFINQRNNFSELYYVNNDTFFAPPHTKIQINEFESILQFSNVTDNDVGHYQCDLMLGHERITRKIVLAYLERPRVYLSLSNITLEEGAENYSQMCVSSGFPKPRTHWITRKDTSHIVVSNSSNLTIRKIARGDTGVYICLADNQIFPAATVYLNLNVQFRPAVQTTAWLVKSAYINVSCNVEANPFPLIQWRFNNDSFNPNAPIVVRSISFTKHQSQILLNSSYGYNGNLSCEATNIIGKSESNVELISYPKIVRVFDYNNTYSNSSVMLKWLIKTIPSRLNYELRFREAAVNPYWTKAYFTRIHQTNSKEQPATVVVCDHYKVESLNPGKSYEWKMTVYNKFGYSKLSQVERFRTNNTTQSEKHLRSSYENGSGCAKVFPGFMLLVIESILIMLLHMNI
ncbi:hypothetical protein GJ496_009449 [Pomphorhynchus laevis]|nr:hypothetical protein GJ496_009449 [Pomphorhynchus laevis]